MTHAEARRIIEEAFRSVHGREPTPLETLYVQAVAWLETNYGRAKGQHATWASQGLYTWANLEKHNTGTCTPPWYPGTDAGNSRCFLLRSSDREAAEDLVKNLTKRHWPVLQAIASDGSAESVAHAMKASPAYYEALESTYAQGLRNATKTILAGAPLPLPLNALVAPSFPWLGVTIAVVGLLGAAYVIHTNRLLPLPGLHRLNRLAFR